ncbi:MAG TPA: hypothetical protein V6C72_07715 [Chroococcales cyanobacterium]
MFKLQNTVVTKSAVIASMLFGLSFSSAMAQSSAQDIAKILADGSAMEVTVLKHAVIVTIPVETALSQDAMREKAVACVRKLAGQQVEELEVVFKSGNTGTTQEISFDAQEMKALVGGAQPKVEITQSQKVSVQSETTGIYSAHSPMTGKIAPTQAQYQAQRADVASQLKSLEAKGVGIAAFVTELKRLDSLYTHAQLAEATQGMTKLADNVQQLEARRQEAQAASHVAKVQPANHGRSSGQSKISSDLLEQGVAAYNGSVDGFVDSIVNEIAQRELGRFIPNKGPFLVERFRIAKRIHELENRNVRVDGFANLYRQMEDLVALRDSRKLPEISNNVKYLQQQLGLTQLEGSLHRPLSL